MPPSLSRQAFLFTAGAGGLGWLLGTLVSRMGDGAGRWHWAGLLLAAFLPCLATWWWTRRHAQRLHHVMDSARCTARSELDRKDPVSRLIRSLAGLRHDLDRAEARQAMEYRTLLEVIESLGNGLIVAGTEGTVQFLSPKARQYWMVAEDWQNQPLRTEVLFRTRETVYDSWRHAVAQGILSRDLYESGDGMEALLVVHAPLYPDASGAQAWITAQLDTSEVALMRLIRRDFIGNLSHELRNALAKLKANAEIAMLARDDAGRRKYMQRTLFAIDEMNTFQQGLMDLYLIETGLEPLQLRETHLPTFLAHVHDILHTAVEAQGLRFVLEDMSDIHLPLDARKITRVLTNLVQNAQKFTSAQGRISLHATVQSLPLERPEFVQGLPSNFSPEERQRLTPEPVAIISVCDTGTGIPLALIPRAFERLRQLDDQQSAHGIGLGLSLARHTIRAHGGVIWARNNQPGPGITFSFSLPLAAEAIPPASLPGQGARPGNGAQASSPSGSAASSH